MLIHSTRALDLNQFEWLASRANCGGLADDNSTFRKYMLFTGREIRIGKTDRPRPVNNVFNFFTAFLKVELV